MKNQRQMKINEFMLSVMLFMCCSALANAQIDTLRFADERCLDYWQNYKKYPDSDSIMCWGSTYIRTKLDSSSYRIDDYYRGTTYFVIEIKKENNILYFKNEYSGNEYKLFFNFNILKGGKIKLSNDTILLEDSTSIIFNFWHQVVFLKKIKIRGEYLYKLRYKPIGFFSSVTNYMYFNKKGELLMEYLGYRGLFCLRTDYFNTTLTDEEREKL